eukprot:TRINITY_DN15569_c0_g3_i1.p2 TRINITY_DN15569_c0_g3~~TRINITY_DN15569_c0_g3_i1.p2  ORF type:complete len:180 (-),score=32.50 TRINITY_DN15569_c0_g3_i1:106-645(-)
MLGSMASWRKAARAAWLVVPPIVFVKDRWMWVYCVDGRSMSPTLNPQDHFVDRWFRDYVLVHKNAEFRNGDVVVLRDPITNSMIAKRLIAKEGEVVEVDGKRATVPDGHCWVEGDNPEKSVDSRNFGPVPIGLLDALVLSVVWPFWRSRWLDMFEEDMAQEAAAAADASAPAAADAPPR